MHKYKIKLQYSLFGIFLIAVLWMRILSIHSCYTENESEVSGRLLSYQIDGNQLKAEIKANEKIILQYYFQTKQEKNDFQNVYQIGDYIHIVGTFSNPTSNRNFHLFNYQDYLKSKQIYWIIKGKSITLEKKNQNIFFTWKSRFYRLLGKKKDAKYFYYLLLGDSSQMDDTFIQKIRTLGISHLFAISGMHVHLLASILIWLLKRMTKKKGIQWILLALFLFFYSFLTDFSPSIVRASLFFLLLFLKKILHLKISSLKILFLILIGMLWYHPYYIYHLGFLFSFTISFSLLFFSRYQKKQSYMKGLIQTSWISFWMGVPILIHSFFEVNFLAPVFNLFFVPFVSLVLFPVCFISIWIPWLQPMFHFLLQILEITVTYACRVSFLTFSFATYPVVLLPIFLGLIGWVLKCNLQKKSIPFLILVVFLFIYYHIAYFKNDSTVTMLDVGQGDAILMILPHQKGNILIDTGGNIEYTEESWKRKKNSYSIAASTLIPYFKSIGIHHLDYLILTHGDYDHMGEAISLVNHFKVDKVIFNCGTYNDLENELIKTLDKKNINHYSCITELNIDDNKLYFLNTKEYNNENDNSSVIYTELHNYKLLLMGDASSLTEKEILNKYNLSNIDVLKVGHHGSKTSSSNDFIDIINPKYSLISVGQNNRYGHPNKETLENLGESKIYRTDHDGSIVFKIKKSKLDIKTCQP